MCLYLGTIPSKLSYFSKEPKTHSKTVATTPRPTVTYYTASSASDADVEIEPQFGQKPHAVHQFRFVDSVIHSENRPSSTPKPDDKLNDQYQYNEIYSSSPRFETTRAPYRERPTTPPIGNRAFLFKFYLFAVDKVKECSRIWHTT